VTLTAAVCKQGHVVSRRVVNPAARLEDPESAPRPGRMAYAGSVFNVTTSYVEVSQFCGQCGTPVLTQCDQCQEAIPKPDVRRGFDQPNPFCVGCSLPFPWASREQRIGQLQNLAAEDGLSDAERLELVEELAILSKPEDQADHPRQIRALTTIKRLAPRAYALALPIFQSTISAEVAKHI
jgi:hypothetical protein